MKRQLLMLAIGLGCLPLAADEADQHYRRGMNAVASGDIVAARNSFMKTLELRPGHPHARFQLNNLKGQKGEMVAKQRSGKLASIVLDRIEFDEVPLSEALIGLNHLIEAKTGEGGKPFSPNFMIQDPKGELGDKEVSLRLRNVPAKVALDYMLQAVSATARYDEHATVIRPAG